MARFCCASHRNPESSLFRTGLFSNQLGAQGHSFKSVPNECPWGTKMACYPIAFLSSARRFFMPVITALRSSGMRAVSIWGTPSSL